MRQPTPYPADTSNRSLPMTSGIVIRSLPDDRELVRSPHPINPVNSDSLVQHISSDGRSP